LRIGANRSELHLDEAEPEGRFFLIVGAKLDLRGAAAATVRPLSDLNMLYEKTKEGAAQATAGNCSQEEMRNGEATMRTQQKKTNGSRKQNKQNGALP
jgi:hypothetical protein